MSQPILFDKDILKLTTVTYVAVVDNVFEAEKRSDKRTPFPNDMLAGFETSPLQRRKREGNKTCMLTYCFDAHSDYRQTYVVKIMRVSICYPMLFPVEMVKNDAKAKNKTAY